MKSLLLAGVLLFSGGLAHAIPNDPTGIDFGSITCTGIYRLGEHFEYNCTTGVLSVDSVTANTIIYQTLISTAGFSVEDFLIELNISTDSLQGQIYAIEVATGALATDKMDRNGLLNNGFKTNVELQSLVCPTATKGACWATSSDEGDRYDSQSSTPGDYRNARTGKAP